MRLSTECCGSPAIVVGEPEGVGSVKVEVGDALSSVMGERDFRLDMFVAVACEKLEKSATIVVIAIASAVMVREKAHDVCVRGSTILDTSVDVSDDESCCLVVEEVKNAVPGMDSILGWSSQPWIRYYAAMHQKPIRMVCCVCLGRNATGRSARDPRRRKQRACATE